MSGPSNQLEPILCAPLLRRVDEKLIELLGSLEPGEWDLPTVAPLWKVRDVAAHLLDTPLRKLSLVRDGWYVEAVDIRSPQDVITLVNRLNREGVAVYRRLSPSVLLDLMKLACEQSAQFHESLDPFAPAAFAVSWAGEERSLNWFDRPRTDRALASPAADSAGHQSAGNDDPRSLPPGARLLPARVAARLPQRRGPGGNDTTR